jgi:hypothetical protein
MGQSGCAVDFFGEAAHDACSEIFVDAMEHPPEHTSTVSTKLCI